MGISIIIISDDMQFIFEACDWFLVMSGGKCAWSGTWEEYLRQRPPAAGGFINLEGRLIEDLSLTSVCTTRAGLVDYLAENVAKAEESKRHLQG